LDAISGKINLGVLLPCNVVIYTRDDGKTALMFMDPIARFSTIGNPDLEAFGIQVTQKLERVLDAL